MNYSELAEQQLKDAVEKGMITVEDTEGVREIRLRSSEILGVAKYILKEGLFKGDVEAEKTSMPAEMFPFTAPLDLQVTNQQTRISEELTFYMADYVREEADEDHVQS